MLCNYNLRATFKWGVIKMPNRAQQQLEWMDPINNNNPPAVSVWVHWDPWPCFHNGIKPVIRLFSEVIILHNDLSCAVSSWSFHGSHVVIQSCGTNHSADQYKPHIICITQWNVHICISRLNWCRSKPNPNQPTAPWASFTNRD